MLDDSEAWLRLCASSQTMMSLSRRCNMMTGLRSGGTATRRSTPRATAAVHVSWATRGTPVQECVAEQRVRFVCQSPGLGVAEGAKRCGKSAVLVICDRNRPKLQLLARPFHITLAITFQFLLLFGSCVDALRCVATATRGSSLSTTTVPRDHAFLGPP